MRSSAQTSVGSDAGDSVLFRFEVVFKISFANQIIVPTDAVRKIIGSTQPDASAFVDAAMDTPRYPTKTPTPTPSTEMAHENNVSKRLGFTGKTSL